MDYPPSTSGRYTSPTPPQEHDEYQTRSETQQTQQTHAQSHRPHRLGLPSGQGLLRQGVVKLVQPQDSALPLAASPQSPRRPPSSPRAPPGTASSSSGASGPAQPQPSNVPTSSTPVRPQEPPCCDQQPLLSSSWSSSPQQATDQEPTLAHTHAPTASSSSYQGPGGQSLDGRGQAQGRLLSPRPASSSCSDSSKTSLLSATAASASSNSSSGSSDTGKDHGGTSTRERGSRPLHTGASQSSSATSTTTSHATVPPPQGTQSPRPPPFQQGLTSWSSPMSHPPATGPRQPQQQGTPSEHQKHAPQTLQPINYPGAHYHHAPPPPPPQYGYPPPGQPVDQYRQSPTGPPPHSLALPSMRSFDHQQQGGQPQHTMQQHPQNQQYPHQPQQTHGQHAPAQYAQHPQHHPMGSTMAPGPHMGYFTINQQQYGIHDPMGMRYGLPPGLYDPRMQLSGGRHKKEIKRRTKTGCLTCRKRRIKVRSSASVQISPVGGYHPPHSPNR
ncbi:hypothetical protein F5883DRAFT_94731 [Diaporthe sp. PMI_573]|nr:hypothetical protein F5883DRAFT_94731 [Diaporthaceae sp. PMI_573]